MVHACTHTDRLQHNKVLSGQGAIARKAATACLNSSHTGLIYLRKGKEHNSLFWGHHTKNYA